MTYSRIHTIEAYVCQISHRVWFKIGCVMHASVQ